MNARLPAPEVMREKIPEIVAEAKTDDSKKHMRQPEDAFLYKFAFPIVFEHIQTLDGINVDKARKSLLSEYYRNMPQYCMASPARKQRHPFSKAFGASTDAVLSQWRGESFGSKLKQSCPDFALRAPFPFKVVFEGKYFSKGGSKKAGTELVTNVYQAFFYRGLPYDDEIKKRPKWDYDYSCLFAYDASEEATLLNTWLSLDSDVKTGFWQGANLYVMIIRGEG